MPDSTEAIADICLVLEGTYPFVPGGVSSWVHQLVTRMPEIRFGILHVTPRPGFYGGRYVYQVPDNVVAIQEIHLQKPVVYQGRRKVRAHRAVARSACAFLDALRRDEVAAVLHFAGELDRLVASGLTSLDLLVSREHWRTLLDCYREEAPEHSFLNFYWNWIFAHQPLLNLLTSPLPRAGAYHTVSTGYAGALAALASRQHDAPMILTEHGIYTKERRIEIHAADWVPVGPAQTLPDIRPPYFQAFWNRHFSTMSRACYAQAERIFTLYSGNRDEQVRDGADPDKISIVPNGIDTARFAAAAARHAARADDAPFTVGFVGRVCPIKDVRTFIAAMRLVADAVDDLDVHIMGPTEEDPRYAEGCVEFAAGLGLGDVIRFRGRVDLRAELDRLDVMVLTSVSEAQPLVVLEAGAVGIPVVSTDVGSCRELIMGRSALDRSLGAGGFLTPIASPGATASAILELYEDPELRQQMGDSLQRRVEKYFDQEVMIDTYRSIYQGLLPAEVG